jgi:FkbM family methyltransferase
LGVFDIVLCCGLLYHLENPFAALRNLYALTGRVLLIESMIVASTSPIASLIDEGQGEDQGLNYIAFVPSESCLTKMLYRTGFPYVYAVTTLPEHEDFRETRVSRQQRTILVAAKVPLQSLLLQAIPEPITKDPWLKPWGWQVERIGNFLRKPWREKMLTARFRFKSACKSVWHRLCPGVPLPVRLPYGGWWLAVNDVCSDAVFTGSFEKAERRFVGDFLQAGMTVLDIGAHHGFYTLLAARKVGPAGRVIAFEPSPRERRRLLFHVKVNRCTNVKVEPFALACQDGETTLFVVDGRDTGCNSLRPPAVSEPTNGITVKTMMLDSYLQQERIHRVDFIKMDVEGAELEILKMAKRLLERSSRPVILCEVDDLRTQPWGYPSQAIIEFLEGYGYRWFGLNRDGRLVSPEDRASYNLVAFPEESAASLSV